MSAIEVTTNTNVKDDNGVIVKDEAGKAIVKSVTIMYDFGDTLAESVSLQGEAAVYAKYIAGAKIEVQAVCRRYLLEGKDNETIKTLMASYKIGAGATRDPKADFAKMFASATPEEQKKLMKELQQLAAAAANKA